MLVQRFRNRIHGASDEELAQITERLFAEQSAFPTDVLLISPGQQQLQNPQATVAPPARKITVETSKSSEQQEDDDNTAELFATLGANAAEDVNSAAASAVTKPIPSDWAPQIPRIAKAVSSGAVLAATVTVASALQRWYRKIKNEDGGETTAPPTSTNKIEMEGGSSTGGSNGFLNWMFGDTVPEKQPEMSSQSPSIDASSKNGTVDTGAVVDVDSMQREESGATSSSSSNGGQVLWRRKDDPSYHPPTLNGSTSSTSSGEEKTVLWRQNENVKEDEIRNGNGNQLNGGLNQEQQDLWRVPLESLKSPGNKESAVGKADSSTISPKPVAPSPRPVPITEKKRMVNGSSGGMGPSKLSESALDNAEPPDFIANGVRKL